MKDRLKLPGISLIAWIAFGILAVAVVFSFAHSKDYRFLGFAILMLAALVIIPMLLARMSRHAYSNATPLYEDKAKFHKISNINLGKVGEVVKIRGTIEKVSFRWLNRPHFSINDGTGIISAILFTSSQESLEVGEEVEVLGTVMRGFPRRGLAVSAVSIRKVRAAG